MVEESQNKTTLAERAFSEAKNLLKAEVAQKQKQKGDEKKTEKKRDQHEEEQSAAAAWNSSDNKQGKTQREEKQLQKKSMLSLYLNTMMCYFCIVTWRETRYGAKSRNIITDFGISSGGLKEDDVMGCLVYMLTSCVRFYSCL